MTQIATPYIKALFRFSSFETVKAWHDDMPKAVATQARRAYWLIRGT